MPRVPFDDLKAELKHVLMKRGCPESTADAMGALERWDGNLGMGIPVDDPLWSRLRAM